jgi:hypothetical protein
VKPLHHSVRSAAVLQVPGLAAGLWTTTGTDELELLVLAEVAAWVLLVELEDATLGVVVGRVGGPRLGGPKLGGPKLSGRPNGG